MNGNPILRGEIYMADFGQQNGSEICGIRPALIISNNMGNKYGPTVIVAAITSRLKALYMPTHLILSQTLGTNSKKRSMVELEQIRTLDKTALKAKIGEVDEASIRKIDHALNISLGLDRYHK